MMNSRAIIFDRQIERYVRSSMSYRVNYCEMPLNKKSC